MLTGKKFAEGGKEIKELLPLSGSLATYEVTNHESTNHESQITTTWVAKI
jgi:hypothetical protein